MSDRSRRPSVDGYTAPTSSTTSNKVWSNPPLTEGDLNLADVHGLC
jgi:hypothetical protein